MKEKTELLKKVEKGIDHFTNYKIFETSTRIIIESRDDFFSCSLVKKVIEICDETNNKFNIIMENSKVKIEIFKH